MHSVSPDGPQQEFWQQELQRAKAARSQWRKIGGFIVCLGAWAIPRAAWAARRYASRQQEQSAQYITLGVLAFLFYGAYLNSRKEDKEEQKRIKVEAERLGRLKKEYEAEFEVNDDEELSDDSLAASLKKAQEQKAEAKEEEKPKAEEPEAKAEEAKAPEPEEDSKPEKPKEDKADKEDKEDKPEKPKDDKEG